MSALSRIKLAELARLRAENERLRDALSRIACWGDKMANEHLEKIGSYGLFDEPSSVQISREVLGNGEGT